MNHEKKQIIKEKALSLSPGELLEQRYAGSDIPKDLIHLLKHQLDNYIPYPKRVQPYHLESLEKKHSLIPTPSKEGKDNQKNLIA